MKVPKYIKEKMHKLAKLSEEAMQLENEIDEYLEGKGIDPEELRDGSGITLTELSAGSDITDDLVKRIESDYHDY